MTLFIIAWIVTSILGYGFKFAYFQRKYPTLAKEEYAQDMVFGLLLAMFPFIQFIVIFLGGYWKYGLKFY